jgi:SAM-dependent methyltransferase
VSDKPLGERNYEQFAHRYDEHSPSKPHNAFYERPATLSLLPDLRGKRVLDAGCGPGHYALELLERGAKLVAVDVTPDMVAITRKAVGDRATVLRANLEEPLDFAADEEFDVVVAPLMLDYIADWTPLFREFFRVLKPGGQLVYSHGHPMADRDLFRERCDPDLVYFDIEQHELPWGGFDHPKPMVSSYRRPLEAMLNPLIDAGFRIDHVLEPRPTEEFRKANPEDYAFLMREPVFLCVRATKDGRDVGIRPAPRSARP